MSESVKEIRERVEQIRARDVRVRHDGDATVLLDDPRLICDAMWLCDQLTRALDRNEAMEQDGKRLDIADTLAYPVNDGWAVIGRTWHIDGKNGETIREVLDRSGAAAAPEAR